MGLLKKVLKKAGKAVKKTKLGGKIVKAVGKGLGFKTSTGRRRRGLNLNRYAQRLIKAKLDGKIMREKLKVVNIIK